MEWGGGGGEKGLGMGGRGEQLDGRVLNGLLKSLSHIWGHIPLNLMGRTKDLELPCN